MKELFCGYIEISGEGKVYRIIVQDEQGRELQRCDKVLSYNFWSDEDVASAVDDLESGVPGRYCQFSDSDKENLLEWVSNWLEGRDVYPSWEDVYAAVREYYSEDGE